MEHGYRFKPLSALLFMIMFFLCISNIIAGVLVDKVSDAGSSTCNPSGEYNAISTYNHNKPDQGFLDGSFVFKPEDITLSDDGFHGSDSLFYTEWWYFDATLNSNYSIQMIINAFGLFNSNLVLVKLNLYRYGDLIISREKVYLSRFFSASSDEPRVLLDGEEAMRGYIADGVWVYNVNISIDDVSVSLVYTGVNKGWKGAVLVGDWVVALPKAYVSGEVVVDDTVIHVEGVGYHDHNYDLNWRMFLVFGWYWGKIHTSNYTLTWSYQMKDTRLDKAPLLVINQGAEDYISIDPGFIEFTMRNYTLHYGYIIPGSVTLKANTENISVLINMDVLDAHHMNVFLFKYTRFHMRCKGYIRVNDHTEVFNQVEITELFRFR